MKAINISMYTPGIAWFFTVLVLLCMPGGEFHTVTWFEKIYLDKWIHAGVFGLLALLFMLPVAFSPIKPKEKLHYLIMIAIATSIWGLISEFIQKYWVYGRSFELLDWAADSLGALIAYLFCKKKYV